MKYPIFIVLLLFSSLAYSSDTKLDENSIFDSANWPPKVAVLEEIKVKGSGKIIEAGRDGIFIRMEDEKSPVAVIDFGRNGIAEVPVDLTDFRDRAKKIASGEVEKETPNWTMMVGRSFLECSDDRGVVKVPLSDLDKYHRMLFLYVDDPADAVEFIEPFVKMSYRLLGETNTLVVVVTMRLVLESEFVPAVEASSPSLNICYMAPHLSYTYATSMHHQLTKFPAAVLTDMEGKTLFKPVDGDPLDQTLNAIANILSESVDKSKGEKEEEE